MKTTLQCISFLQNAFRESQAPEERFLKNVLLETFPTKKMYWRNVKKVKVINCQIRTSFVFRKSSESVTCFRSKATSKIRDKLSQDRKSGPPTQNNPKVEKVRETFGSFESEIELTPSSEVLHLHTILLVFKFTKWKGSWDRVGQASSEKRYICGFWPGKPQSFLIFLEEFSRKLWNRELKHAKNSVTRPYSLGHFS